MAREGLMDDTGYHGFDTCEDFTLCEGCKNLEIETWEDGRVWMGCAKDEFCEYEEKE